MKLSNLLVLVLTIVSSFAANVTIAWDQNTETNITSYKVYRGVNGGGYLSTSVAYPNHQFTYTDLAPGNSYSFYATAVDSEMLESAPSSTLSFTPAPLPPPLNVQRVTVSGVIGGSQWTGVQVFFDTVNLALYQATNYVITATSTNGVTTIPATNSPAIFALLPVKSYTFSAAIINNSGTSGPGTTQSLSGIPPAVVQNVKVLTGP